MSRLLLIPAAWLILPLLIPALPVIAVAIWLRNVSSPA